MKASKTIEEAAELFWAKVDKQPGCWVWVAAKNAHGYGNFRSNTFFKGELLAHRVSFRLAHGRPPRGVLRHSCDNPSCVNPEHLAEGSMQDNSDDMVARRRHGSHRRSGYMPSGSAHHFYAEGPKLDRATAGLIRAEAGTLRGLALKYGVSSATVWNIKKGRIWKDGP